MYKINPSEIIQMKGRKKDLVEARRLYIYYLNRQKNIPLYNDLKIKYIELLYQADPEEFYKLHSNIIFADTMKKIIKIIN